MEAHNSNVFISYTQADKGWAEWIAYVVKESGWTVTIQAWDFRAGDNFVIAMDAATKECGRTIVVLSPSFLRSKFTQAEWAAAFARDPDGKKRLLIPVRVQPCTPEGLLGQIVYVDLVGLSQEDAQKELLATIGTPLNPTPRPKPTTMPRFPDPGRKVRALVALGLLTVLVSLIAVGSQWHVWPPTVSRTHDRAATTPEREKPLYGVLIRNDSSLLLDIHIDGEWKASLLPRPDRTALDLPAGEVTLLAGPKDKPYWRRRFDPADIRIIVIPSKTMVE